VLGLEQLRSRALEPFREVADARVVGRYAARRSASSHTPRPVRAGESGTQTPRAAAPTSSRGSGVARAARRRERARRGSTPVASASRRLEARCGPRPSLVNSIALGPDIRGFRDRHRDLRDMPGDGDVVYLTTNSRAATLCA
jgi:hypothetical protein